VPDEYVTKSELAVAIAEIRGDMEKGFGEIKGMLAQMSSQQELNKHEFREEYDKRYVRIDQNYDEALKRINRPEYRQACFVIASDYLTTEDARQKIGCIIDAHYAAKRDSATKWMNFIKTLVAGIILAGMLYGGNTVIQTQKSNQKALINLMETIKGE